MVAERIYRIPQVDLVRVRITCKNPACKKTAEMTVDEARATFDAPKCRFCNAPLASSSGLDANPFVALATAWQLFAAEAERMSLEFVIPADEGADK